MTPMPDVLERIEERLAAATPGNLEVVRYAHGGGRVHVGRTLVADFFHEGDREAWLLARNLFPELLAVVRAAGRYDASIIEAERLAVESMTCSCVTESGECEHDRAYYAANDARRAALEANRAALAAFRSRAEQEVTDHD